MPRDAAVERVFGQQVGTGDEAEARRRDDQMQEAGLATDRTVAIERFDARGRIDLDAYAAAMATAAMDDERPAYVDEFMSMGSSRRFISANSRLRRHVC